MQSLRAKAPPVLFLALFLAPILAPASATPGPSTLREAHHHVESTQRPICEDALCGTSLTEEACDACALYRQVMNSETLEHVQFSGVLIERGVALRVVSPLPEVQDRLFAVILARNEILQQVHEGTEVDLCEPCDANARSFVDVDYGVERIPDGVILSYTSSRDDLVRLLQVMLLHGHELPL